MAKLRTLEDIYEHIGGFGKFQWIAIAIILFPEWPGAMLELQPIFTGANPAKWTCSNESGTFDVSRNEEALCSCSGVLEGSLDSIVSEWKLICGYAWVVDFITSIQMFGMIAGDIVGTICADRYGRKNTLYVSSFTAMVGSLLSSTATSPTEYAFARFFVGAGVSAVMILSVYYAMEFLTPRWRVVSGAAGFWGEGVLTLAILAYFYQSWRSLCVMTALPLVFFMFSYPFLPESPRWLIANGKIDEAQDVIDTIARWNGRPRLRGGIMDNLAACVKLDEEECGRGGGINNKEDREAEAVGIFTFLQNPECLKRTVILMFAWFTCHLLYYGIGFNIKNLSGDPYWNVVYVALVDMVGFRSAIVLSQWLGRKKSFVGYMAVSAFCMVNSILMETGYGLTRSDLGFNLLNFVGKMCAAASMGVVECFTAESYPTYARSLGVGFANFAGSIGAIIAPQMAFLGSFYKIGPYFIFSFFAVICTWMTMYLSETNGKPIQESFKKTDEEVRLVHL